MATRKVTFRLPVELLSRVKKVAANRNVSVTALVREVLTREISGGVGYEAAMVRQLALMDAGFQLHGECDEYDHRDSLHERAT